MHRMRTAVTAAGVAGVTVFAAGCGSGQAGDLHPLHGSPHQQVLTSFQNLTRGDTLTGTLHLGADAASLLRFGARMGGGSNLTGNQAQALAGAAISFTVHSTTGSLRSLETQSAPTKSEQLDLTFTDQGRRYAELRVVDTNVYAQADVKGIMALVGRPGSAYDKALAGAEKAPAGVRSVAVAFLTGKWVEVQGSQLQGLQNKLRSQAGPNTFPTPNALQRRRFLANLEDLFAKDVAVKQDQSSSAGGTYTLTANTRRLVASVLKSLTQLEPTLSGQLNALPLTQVPSRSITFGARVTDSELSRLSFDFAQLSAKPGTPHLPLDLDFTTASKSVDAPSGAVTVDLRQLMRALLVPGLQGGVSSGGALKSSSGVYTG